MPGQSRIAFRTPAASPKGESAPGGYKANFGNNAPPAKDGDVVVSLAEPLLGGTDFFTLTGGEKKGGMAGFLGVRPGADAQFVYTATISDPAAYRDDVVGMVNVAQRDMVSLNCLGQGRLAEISGQQSTSDFVHRLLQAFDLRLELLHPLGESAAGCGAGRRFVCNRRDRDFAAQ